MIETDGVRKTFLIEGPGKIVITAGSDGPVELSCGPQKNAPLLELGYDAPSDGLRGVHGIVHALAF